MIEAAPFPVRPDSVRPADLLGPYDGIVLDADTGSADRRGDRRGGRGRFERGIGLQAPAGAYEFVTETGADGRYTVPKLDDLPERRFDAGPALHADRLPPRPRRWRSDRLFPGREARRDFSQRGNRVRLEKWQSTLRHAEHLAVPGRRRPRAHGRCVGAAGRGAASWRASSVPAAAAGAGEPRVRRSPPRRSRWTSRSC